MLSEEIIEKLVERLVNRIEAGNAYVLERIGNNLKALGELNYSSAYRLAQVLKYGGSYEEIARKLAEITELNVQDIYKIFEQVAKNDYQFSKQFYDYKGIDYIPWEKNIALQEQVKAIAKITANEYVNLSKTRAFARVGANGKIIYTDLAKTYQDLIDEAVISISQGKTTFDEYVRSTIREIGGGGIQVEYPSGTHKRLDSAVRMNVQEALTSMHNETQKMFGEEFGANGVEVSVHFNPAPDHAEVQGRQFSYEEFEKLQTEGEARDYTGKFVSLWYGGKSFRPIGMYNCYHYNFEIVLGVSDPEYSNEQLNEINRKNITGFEFEGKHYTNYQGTQLQRKIETEIRRQKEKQILAKASGSSGEEEILKAQKKITQLTRKYRDLNKASKLPNRMDRMRVSGYKRVAVKSKK